MSGFKKSRMGVVIATLALAAMLAALVGCSSQSSSTSSSTESASASSSSSAASGNLPETWTAGGMTIHYPEGWTSDDRSDTSTMIATDFSGGLLASHEGTMGKVSDDPDDQFMQAAKKVIDQTAEDNPNWVLVTSPTINKDGFKDGEGLLYSIEPVGGTSTTTSGNELPMKGLMYIAVYQYGNGNFDLYDALLVVKETDYEANEAIIEEVMDSIDVVADPAYSAKAGSSSSSSSSSSSASSSDSSSFLNTLKNAGTFESTTVSGTGDDVIDVPCAPYPCIMVMSHDGSSNFAVKSYDSSGNKTDLLVNEIGPYNGTVTSYEDYESTNMLEITASGNWSITFAPLSEMPKAENGSTFHGDSVVYIDESSLSKITFSHNGTSNFAVRGIGLNSAKLLVNEIGEYNGTVIWGEPKSFFIVTADGDWTISW